MLKSFKHIWLAVLTMAVLLLSSCEGCDQRRHAPSARKVRKVRRMEYRRNVDGTVDTTFVVDDTLAYNLDSVDIIILKDTLEEFTDEEFAKRYFVEVCSVIPDLIEDIRYCSDHNFVGRKIDGYEEPVALLTRECADSLKLVADELRKKGFRLKIYDAYRPDDAVQDFRRWVGKADDQLMKSEFYPDIEKQELFREGYISSRSRHCHGSTVDMTLCLKDSTELDMGGHFDLFSETSHSDHTETLSAKQQANRALLRETMERHGFKVARTEWWHFTLEKEPYPDISFNFKVKRLVSERNQTGKPTKRK